jgi:hypothetical protein
MTLKATKPRRGIHSSSFKHYNCLFKYPSCDANTGFVHRSTYQHPLPGETARDIPLGCNAEDAALEVSLAASLSPLRVTEEDDDGKSCYLCVSWVESSHIWEVLKLYFYNK